MGFNSHVLIGPGGDDADRMGPLVLQREGGLGGFDADLGGGEGAHGKDRRSGQSWDRYALDKSNARRRGAYLALAAETGKIDTRVTRIETDLYHRAG